MGDIAVRVEDLCKRYEIGAARRRHDTLRDQIADGLKTLFGNNGRPRQRKESIWALKDVSFEIKHGEVVGVIGRNGAGKSTLLKILSRITEPTTGYADIHGRVGSLLEVGTGFHGELTGRENIYLNGAILGMKKWEIDKKFDEIVAFSEVEKFMDTPVKRYSSGMYVRLAFAVAAHLEPEILIVDEVLSVGDALFQQKCLGKMGNVAKEGRTVLLVSHNMPTIQSLCDCAVLMENGRMVAEGKPSVVVDRYLYKNSEEIITDAGVLPLRDHPRRLPNMRPALTRMWLTDVDNNILTSVAMGAEVVFHVEYEVEGFVRQPIVGLTFETPAGHRVFGTNNKMAPGALITNGPSRGILSCHVPRLPLVAGEYFITVAFAISAEDNFDKIERAFKLKVLESDVYGTGHIPVREDGDCVLDCSWRYAAH
jgi:lipopolysaccharide transport system ATP-binding protein